MSAVLGELSGARTRPATPPRVPPLAGGGQPQVSVVVPTCGRPELLLRCLQGLLTQELQGTAYEVLVVDDGRCDRVQTLVQSLADGLPSPELRYLRPAQGRGPAAARNAGWRAARGEIVAFTDDDTQPMAGWLAQGVEALRQGPWSAVAGRVVVPSQDHPPTDHERTTRGLESSAFVTANAFVRRTALLQVQGFDERFTRAWREDADLHFRLEDIAGPVGRCEDAVVLHPVRRERWGVSLRRQQDAYFEALLYAKHPRRYRQGAGLPPPWDHYAIVALTVATLLLAGEGIVGSAVVSALLVLGLVLGVAGRRLRGTSHRADHVLEVLLSSAVIPFLSVYWRLRGALHFRVWFL